MPIARVLRSLLAVLTTLTLLAGGTVLASPAQAAPITTPLELTLSAANTAALHNRGVIPIASGGATITSTGFGASRQWTFTFPALDKTNNAVPFAGSITLFNLFTWRSETISALVLGQETPFVSQVFGRLASRGSTSTRIVLFGGSLATVPVVTASTGFTDALNRVSGGGVTGSPLGTMQVSFIF